MTLLDTQAAAVAAGVDPRTIRRWVHTGRLENHGTPRRIRIPLAQLWATRPRVSGLNP